MEPILCTYADPDLDIQRPFDVAVVIPSLLRDQLAHAVRSIFQQDLEGTIQILIGIDAPQGSLEQFEKLLEKERPAHIAVTLFWPGYSTKQARGGMWRPWGGGSLRSLLSFLANARYVAYLDDDNWYSPDHLSSLLSVIKDKAWAFSRRWFVTEDGTSPIHEDIWESVGPENGVFKTNFGGFVDTNCYLIDKLQAYPSLALWSHTDPRFIINNQEHGEDRCVFDHLHKHHPNAGDTLKPTVSYCLNGEDLNADSRWQYVKDHELKTGLKRCKGWIARPAPKALNKPSKQKKTGSLHVIGSVTGPFEVSIVIPTLLRQSLLPTLRSVFCQDIKGALQVLIGIDQTNDEVQDWVAQIEKDCPDHIQIIIFNPGYSTSKRHGGVHPAFDGGALRTILSFLAQSPHVAYLDDDNQWHKDHLSRLKKAIGTKNYAYSLRQFIHPDGETPVCVDRWESVGPNKGFYTHKFNGFVDPNCLMIHAASCLLALPLWTKPLPDDKEAMSADRLVWRFLARFGTGISTEKATVDYVLNPKDPMHPLRTMYLGQRWLNGESVAFKKKSGLFFSKKR
ncbi:conserved hypothetical protein [Candidatus Terasakiella magnetica]|uniref:Glycosyltransferase 2-like domain-containing protein n=1 Tax=Candidatus Terasakiella magnetica TaxID=1867952 RepID=A0A1C3RGE2_9PROT|nr:glycosyltransferase [Candidatus Terasakiella magnetica]SCA56318.1 conserved hypothetical protein [Candidatus Terasakiella magnetica]